MQIIKKKVSNKGIKSVFKFLGHTLGFRLLIAILIVWITIDIRIIKTNVKLNL